MKWYPHDLHDNERCYVTVRISNAEHKVLRAWMKTHPEQPCVTFSHGVRLERRTMGWYRLNPSNVFRGAEKIKTAFAILRKFAHEYQRSLAAAAQQHLNAARPDIKVVAFTSDNRLGGGQYHVRKNPERVQPTNINAVASTNKLLALQQHFRR